MSLNREQKEYIQDTIDGLLIQTGMSFPKNSIMELCKKLGIEHTLGKLDKDTSGLIFLEEDNRPKIVINESEAKVRQHFSLAHELGHYVLGHAKKDAVYRSVYWPKDDPDRELEEAQANYFAAALLVPDHELREVMHKGTIEQIAGYFAVSVAVIIHRLREIKEVC